MKSKIKGMVVSVLFIVFFFPVVVRAQELFTVVQLQDDTITIPAGERNTRSIFENDTIENIPEFGWMFQIWQDLDQPNLHYSLWGGAITFFEPQPGRYTIYYRLTWPEGVDEAIVNVVVLNWDGSDPPQPPSPLSPLYIPMLMGE